MSPEPRPYRSRNRQRPCDRCRHQKLRCIVDGHPPCQRCSRSNAACTFSGRRSQRSASPLEHELPAPREAASSAHSPSPSTPANQHPATASFPANHGTSTATIPTSIAEQPWTTAPTPSLFHTQISQSLDGNTGHSYLLTGASSDSDPWLLRHCKFDDFGFRRLFKDHVRNAGGVPTRDKIPAHFIVSESETHAPETRIAPEESALRQEVARLVPGAYGARLLNLYIKHVFPLLPILSRTELGLAHPQGLVSEQAVANIPTHLLAALYATALPFAWEDDHLAMWSIYESPSTTRLWRICYELILSSLQQPRLHVVQAAVLYMHKPLSHDQEYAASATAFDWSFMGLVVGLAHSLGLHMECGIFGIPVHETRVRRRLWWVLYVQDKWLSLLLGRPPYIRSSEWDVDELDDEDFVQGGLYESAKIPFRDLASLTLILEDVQEKLYSLRSSQRLAEDMAASIEIAQPLFHRLGAWRESLPLATNNHCVSEASSKFPYPATIYTGYLTLVICVWRALLRTTVPSSEPAQVIHIDASTPQPFMGHGLHLNLDFPELVSRVDSIGPRGDHSLVAELYEASLNCLDTFVGFVLNLHPASYSEFWHSWARTEFSLVSNFLMLLLVQAPDSARAVRARDLLVTWRRVLDYRCKAFPPFLLAKVRLGAYFCNGLEETFHLPAHVQQVLRGSS